MTHKKILFTMLSLATLTASAQRLSIVSTTIDCGQSEYQQPVKATFEMKNRGIRRLHIENVHPDCGCTHVEYPKKEIGIGEKFNITVTYDGQQLGYYQKQIAIESNATKKPVYLTIKGQVVEELQNLTTDYPYDLGGLLIDCDNLEFDDVNKGDRPMQEIHIMNNTTATIEPTVMHLPPFLSATVIPQQLLPGKKGTISFTLESSKIHNLGLNQTQVYLGKNPGEKVQFENEIGINAILLPDLTVFEGKNHQYAPKLELSDEAINLGPFNGKAKKSGDITLTNNGRTPLTISSLQMFTQGLKVTLAKSELQPGETTKLKVTATRSELSKARTKPRVLMITNDPEHTKVVIAINCE